MTQGIPSDTGIRYMVRCDRCDEVIATRVEPDWDGTTDDLAGGRVVVRHIVGARCFRVITLTLRYDDRGELAGHAVDGGEWVPDAPPDPPP